MKKVYAIYHRRVIDGFKDGKPNWQTIDQEVRVLATAEGYAMVRVKNGGTFAVREKEITKL